MSKQLAVTKDLRKKTIKELQKMLYGMYKDRAKSQLELTMNKTKHVNILSGYRKAVARIKTVLHEKNLLEKISKKVVSN